MFGWEREEAWQRFADEQDLQLALADLRRDVDDLKLYVAHKRIAALELELKYRPDQPRAPAGYREGGQWTRDGSGTPSAHPRNVRASPAIDLGAILGVGKADAAQPVDRPEWAKNLSKDGQTYYGQKYVPNAALPPNAQRVLGNAQRVPTPEGMILNLPSDYTAVPAPQGGGILLVPPEYKPGDRANVVRIQPFGTGSSTRHDYSSGYFVVHGGDGKPISAYNGRSLPQNSPGVHNPYGRLEPPIFKGNSTMSEPPNFDRPRQIVSEMIGLKVSLTYAQFGFDIHMMSPKGTIRIDVGTEATIIEGGSSTAVQLDDNPPFSPLIEALDGETITAARLYDDLLELEFGSTLVQIPHTPDLWSFSIGVNFGEDHPLSGLWFF